MVFSAAAVVGCEVEAAGGCSWPGIDCNMQTAKNPTKTAYLTPLMLGSCEPLVVPSEGPHYDCYRCATLSSVSKNSGNEMTAESAPLIDVSPCARNPATANAMAIL